MKLKNIFLPVLCCMVLLSTQACFQDLDNDPPFDYPEGTPDPTGEYNPLKLYLPFEDNIKDQSTYQFQPALTGKSYGFTEGINGKAFNAIDSVYMLIQPHDAIRTLARDTIAELGAFTVSFWINTPRNSAAVSIFSITNTTTFWSNLDIYFDNGGTSTQAQMKVHLLNFRTGVSEERWVEMYHDDFFGSWQHMAFVYDDVTSTFSVYRNGTLFTSAEWPNYGKIVFNNLGDMVIGTFPFMVEPSLTSGASAQSWANYLEGKLDQFRLYNVPLSATAVKNLYDSKE